MGKMHVEAIASQERELLGDRPRTRHLLMVRAWQGADGRRHGTSVSTTCRRHLHMRVSDVLRGAGDGEDPRRDRRESSSRGPRLRPRDSGAHLRTAPNIRGDHHCRIPARLLPRFMQTTSEDRWAKCDMLYTFSVRRLRPVECGRRASNGHRDHEYPRLDLATLRAVRRAIAAGIGLDVSVQGQATTVRSPIATYVEGQKDNGPAEAGPDSKGRAGLSSPRWSCLRYYLMA